MPTEAKAQKVLLIEDEEMLSNMYKIKFEQEGFEFIAAKDGVTGAQLAKTEKPDIILLDIIMPKMDGFAVLKKICEETESKNIPVILLTNLGQDEDIKKGKALGAKDYLVKAELTPSQVLEKVKKFLIKN